MKCDLCGAPTPNCPPMATWCYCGLFMQACSACVKEHGPAVKGRVRVVHEATHEVVT